jgi:hypothetical protein
MSGFESFPCYPTKLLQALGAMPPDAALLYTIIILRQYEVGGPVPDAPDVLARRCGGLKQSRVVQAIEWLTKNGKLIRSESGLEQPRATEWLAALRAEQTNARNLGIEGAKKRWEKTEQKQRNGDSPPIDSHYQPQLSLGSREEVGDQGSEEEQEEQEIQSKKPRARDAEKRRRRFPEGWTPGRDGYEFGLSLGFPRETIAQMFDAFRDHHTSRGNSFLDWQAAWRTWCRNEVKWKGGSGSKPPNGSGSNGASRLIDIATGGRNGRSH